MVGAALADMRRLLESLPDNPDPDDVVRFRGASVDLVSDRVKHFEQLVEDGSDAL